MVKNQDVTSHITTAYHRMVYSYAEDKSIFSHDIIDLTKAVRMTSCVWQFYRKYLGSRRTDFRTLILDLTYRNQDLGETILGRNAVIRINIKRHFGYLHLLSTFIHELAHFLENRFCEVDHGNTFYSLGMTLINILQCSNLDLTEYGISQTDIAKLEISIMWEKIKKSSITFLFMFIMHVFDNDFHTKFLINVWNLMFFLVQTYTLYVPMHNLIGLFRVISLYKHTRLFIISVRKPLQISCNLLLQFYFPFSKMCRHYFGKSTN